MGTLLYRIRTMHDRSMCAALERLLSITITFACSEFFDFEMYYSMHICFTYFICVNQLYMPVKWRSQCNMVDCSWHAVSSSRCRWDLGRPIPYLVTPPWNCLLLIVLSQQMPSLQTKSRKNRNNAPKTKQRLHFCILGATTLHTTTIEIQ